MKVYGYHGTYRHIAKSLLSNHNWSGSELKNELGTGTYFYINHVDDDEKAERLAACYPKLRPEDMRDAIWVLRASWEDDRPGLCIDLNSELWKDHFEKYKRRFISSLGDSGLNKNNEQLESDALDEFCSLLSKNDRKVLMVFKTIDLPSSYFRMYHPTDVVLCACVRDIHILSVPEKVNHINQQMEGIKWKR